MPAYPAPEYGQILACLTGIRRRLWSVRLLERITLAVQWGALVAILLGASRLLREPLPWENFPWMALFLAILPLAGTAWLFHASSRFRHLGLSSKLVRLVAVVTALLSIAMTLLLFIPLGKQIPVWSVPVGTISVFVIIASATVRMVDIRAAAIYVDQQVGLKERVSTALEMLATSPKSPLESAFRTPVIASAVGACQQVRTAKVGYRRLDSRLYAVAALVAIAAASVTLIPPMPARAVTVRKPSTIIVKQSKDLRDVLKEIEDKKLPNDKVTPEKIKPLENAITQLQNGNMSQIESSAILNQAKEQLKREQDAMAASDRAQDMLKQMTQTQDMAHATDAIKDAQMQQAQGDASAAEQQKSAQQALKSAADAMADKMKSGQMSDADKKALGDQLQAAADKASADPQLQKDLQSAADAAKNGDADKLSQSLQNAGQRMGQQSAGNQMSQGAMSKAMSEIDRMQNSGQPGSQSTMGGQQGGPQGQPGQGGQQAQQGQNGQQGQQGGQQAGQQGGQGGQQANAGQDGHNPGQGQGASNASGTTSDNGSTMLENKGGPDGHHEGPLGGVKTFVRIYDPTVTNTSGNQEKVGSFIDPLHPPAASIDVMGSADDKNSQIKTYQDVLPEARRQAMDDLTRQEYPPQYQDMVRQFYNDTPQK